ncbi:hypothetical protein ACQEU3_27695 [Spirillospora sp. CA-253888]
MSDAGPGRPPMGRDEADRTLAHLLNERERISSALLELEAHQGHQLLEGASLAGATAERQRAVQERTTALWELFNLYEAVLGRARELRARHSRPGQAQLAELTMLLAGPSVELPAEEVPLERRTLLSPPAGERITLAAAVQRMTPLYEEAARLVAAVDTVWSALLERFEDVDRERRAAVALAERLGASDPALDRVSAELDALGATIRTDPLALSRGDRADTARLDAAARELADLRRGLEEAARVQGGHAERLDRLRAAIAEVRAAEQEALRARDEVLVKIASPSLPDLPDRARALEDRLAAVAPLAGQRRWADLAARTTDLEAAAATALEQARAATGLITGLLDRREELRGRLEAYRMKAARLGHAEDPELGRIYRAARDLLWTSPCDLRKATVTLSGYQQAISSRAKGPNG